MKKRRGRPGLQDRKTLTNREARYAELRVKGRLSVAEAADQIGASIKEVEAWELHHPVLRAKMVELEGESARETYKQILERSLALLISVETELKKSITEGTVKLGSLREIHSLLKSVSSDIEIYRSKLREDTEVKKQGLSFGELLRTLPQDKQHRMFKLLTKYAVQEAI